MSKEILLTKNQKRVVLEYVLGEVSKGLFEDRLDDFLEGTGETEEEFEDKFDDYLDAINNYVEEVKQNALDDLEN